MVSEVNLFAGLGAVGAEPAVPAGPDDTPGGSFAALVAQASMDAGAANGAHPVEGVINRVFVAEWCLAAPDVAAAATIDGTEEEAGDIEGTIEFDEETSEDGLAGMLTELVGVQAPVVVPPIALPVEPVAPGRAHAETDAAPAAPGKGAGPDARMSQPPSAGTLLSGSERTLAATAADALPGPASNRAAEPGDAFPTVPGEPVPATRAPSAGSKRELAQSADENQRDPAVQGNVPALSADLSIQGAASAETVEGPSEVTPRARAAAAQLSKAIERVGGHTTSQPIAVHVEGSQGEAASGEHAPAGSSPEDHAPAGTAPARPHLHAPMPAFSSHVVTELQRQPTVSQAGPVVPLPGHEAPPDAGTTDQIVHAIRMQFRDGIGDAVIRLKPEHLGEVSVSLRVDQQTVSATVHAEVPAVRQWLESQESMLRNSLSEQGLHLDKFAVREDESGRKQQEQEDADSPRKATRPLRSRRDEDEPRFEVVV
ncbi:MAG: flagellar hook-length control protein FliK [Vicinamibacterales bacterium]